MSEMILLSSAQSLKCGSPNDPNSDTSAWFSQVKDLVDSYATPDQMVFRSSLNKNFFLTPTYAQLFEAPTHTELPFVLPGTIDIVVQRSLSKSPLASQSDEERKKAEETLMEIVRKGEGMVWIDEEKGVFEYPYKTLSVIVKQKGASGLRV